VLVRLVRERREHRAHECGLRGGHPRMRRHLERAHLDEALPAVRRLRIEQLVDRDLGAVRGARDVDQQVAQQPSTCTPGATRVAAEARLELVQRVVARFVDAWRLRRRSDEQPAEHVRQRRVMLRERDQAREQLGANEPRRTLGRRPADGDVVAAARAGGASVEQVALGRQAGRERGC
jgi:hypothetical protein